MALRTGPDIRNGNWFFYDNNLLDIDGCEPDEFQAMIRVGKQMILDAAFALYEKNVSANPTSRIHYPWTFALRIAGYDNTFTLGLTEDAEAITPGGGDDSYSREYIRPNIYPYLDAVRAEEFAWRVPGRMKGWSQARDGLWLQIRDLQQDINNAPYERIRKSPGDSDAWPTLDEEARNRVMPPNNPGQITQ